MQEHEVDATLASFAANIANIVLLILVAIAALSQLGVPTASFVAIVGAAGLAIGLALQSSLSNFASGILMVLFHPIKLGDYIEAGGASGSVETINVFSTTLITPDQRAITVPNSLIMGGPIINYSTSAQRRLDLLISVPYDCDLTRVKQIIDSVVKADDRVLSDKAIRIGVTELGTSSVNIAVWPWVTAKDYLSAKFDLQESIKHALEAENIRFPIPQMNLQVGGESGELRQAQTQD